MLHSNFKLIFTLEKVKVRLLFGIVRTSAALRATPHFSLSPKFVAFKIFAFKMIRIQSMHF